MEITDITPECELISGLAEFYEKYPNNTTKWIFERYKQQVLELYKNLGDIFDV